MLHNLGGVLRYWCRSAATLAGGAPLLAPAGDIIGGELLSSMTPVVNMSSERITDCVNGRAGWACPDWTSNPKTEPEGPDRIGSEVRVKTKPNARILEDHRHRVGNSRHFTGDVNNAFTRRPRPERKPFPVTPNSRATPDSASSRPKQRSDSASADGPDGTSALASSATASLASRSCIAAHQANGFHHASAHTVSASVSHNGSHPAKCASSCANIASRCSEVKRREKPAGTATVGRHQPKAIGPRSRAQVRVSTPLNPSAARNRATVS